MNGLLLIDKPVGITSHDVVSRVRRILRIKEVGHSGTLDPLASGLMVLLIGEATKLSSFVTDGDKRYTLGIRLGLTTDTLDITGQVLTEKPITCEKNEVIQSALSLQGEFELPIPMYSAKKIDGKKLYEYARENEVIIQPKKIMKFWSIKNESSDSQFLFSLDCSKGSFIRSWAQFLGEKLGCGAVLSSLVRTKSHVFQLEQAYTLDSLTKLVIEDKLKPDLIPLDQALAGTKKIRIKGLDATLMKNGQISHQLRQKLITMFNPETDEFVQILPQEKGKLLALVGLEKGSGFKIKRVFNY